VPSYRHRVPAGMGLVVGPGRRRQPSMCWINTATDLAPLSWRRIIGMALTTGMVTIVTHMYESRLAAEVQCKWLRVGSSLGRPRTREHMAHTCDNGQ
jgi:hypothetical protein